jgi:hypothetical protein
MTYSSMNEKVLGFDEKPEKKLILAERGVSARLPCFCLPF